VRPILRTSIPVTLIAAAVRPRAPRWQRVLAGTGLIGLWSAVYVRYRAEGRAQTAKERELLRTATPEAFTRHYNERVPTVEEELDLWGDYHRHRHELRYDTIALATRALLPVGGRLLDVGCGAAMVADRLLDIDATYVGIDFGGHHIRFAAKKLEGAPSALRRVLARGDAEAVPFADATFDVVVISEVIEHLLRPELAVWEIARVLRPGGALVLTTNNASEVPLRSPLTHAFAWLEKAIGADHPQLISLRPWVWPIPVDADLLADDAGEVYLPHTHHIAAETGDLLEAAGLHMDRWSTFEFPPPQSASAAWLDARGAAGRRAVDVLEDIAQRVPLVKRLGCHLFLVATKIEDPVAPEPPPSLWPGPFSAQAATP
jgi:ubiquinone/menaquinone biosynthesis C-methylase UbiE